MRAQWEWMTDARAEIDRFRGGKIVRSEVLGFGRDEVQTALEAAGLSQ